MQEDKRTRLTKQIPQSIYVRARFLTIHTTGTGAFHPSPRADTHGHARARTWVEVSRCLPLPPLATRCLPLPPTLRDVLQKGNLEEPGLGPDVSAAIAAGWSSIQRYL